ncbi:peptidase M20 [Candidatus Viridilinea mediisalina]|uniref:Peptidase M20 n=2 Tax=Candidatus Viridilinea mediisalina TaxID=2024553 RepID=A0A2A6RM23_9CHLR|nr:peptidase M20 [Candidatus Viridilinea mediisalina]
MDIQHWRKLPAVQCALTELSDYRPLLETAIAVQQIPAPTFDEAERGNFVLDRFRGLGLSEVSKDALGNVYGLRRGQRHGSGLLISAHLDTVFPRETNLRVRYEGERVYGPGIGDNSTGLAGLIHVAQILQRHDLPNEGNIWFVANVGEEGLGDLRGMKAAIERLRHEIKRVIVLEGCDFGTLHHQAIGVRRYRIEATAPGGHSWGNFGTASAIHTLVRLGARIAALHVPHNPRTTFNIGMIEGGTSVNTIAQHASMLLDMRSVNANALASLINEVNGLIADAANEAYEVQIQVQTVGDRPSGTLPRNHALVQAAVAAYHSVGAQVNFQQSSTDANIPLSQGIPAICMGLTDGGNAHRHDEFILPALMGRGFQALLLLALAASQ